MSTHTHTHSLSNRGTQAKARKRIAEAAAAFENANFEDLRRNGDRGSPQPSTQPPKPRTSAQDSSHQAQMSDHKGKEMDALKTLDVVAFNSHAESKFVELIAELASKEALHITTAIQEAAFELNVSTETAKRYLMKHSARRAEFKIEGNLVKLRGS